MELLLLAALVVASGVVPTVYASLRLVHAARVTGEARIALEAISLLVFAVGLAIEAIGVFSALAATQGHPPPWARHRVEGVELGQVIQASLLAGYLYVASYAVHAGALYSGRLEPLLPTILLVYSEYNMVAVVFLAATLYALIEVYRATRQAIAYHALLCVSHVAGIAAAAAGGYTLLAPPILRAAAAWMLAPWGASRR